MARVQFKTAFKEAVRKYVNTAFPSEASRAKAAITRIVNNSKESNTLEQIQEILGEFDELPDWIRNRFTPGSLYREGNLVFGWYREDQVQAEKIPVDIPLTAKGYLRVVADGDGFYKPVDLPLSGGVTVSVPCEQAFYYAKYGYANACEIQWHRDEEGYRVDRSIIPHGFWQAWKWWDGAWHWYMKNRPELFEHLDCWGESMPDCQIKPGSAVLGHKNGEFWESQKFYLD